MSTKSIKEKILLLYDSPVKGREESKPGNYEWEVRSLPESVTQQEYIQLLHSTEAETVLLVKNGLFSWSTIADVLGNYLNEKHSHCVGYVNNSGKQRKGSGILNLWKADEKVIESPLFLGPKSFFLKTYAGQDLCAEPMKAVGYSLYKTAGIKFCPIKTKTDIGKNLLPPQRK